MNGPFRRRVLVVDDDPVISSLVSRVVSTRGCLVETAETGAEALAAVRAGFEGVVILDVRLPDMDGPTVFRELRRMASELPVIFLTSYGTTDLALDAIQDGAFEFIDKSTVLDRLGITVENAFRQMTAHGDDHRGEHGDGSGFSRIVTQSALMKTVFRSLRKAISSNVPVLVTGESGTGKELIARAVHSESARLNGPFMAINCAGIPEPLLEAELFGYERGAFTGAVSRKIGRFEAARGGTLLLDEIGEMHPVLQAKLLRVLQEGEFQRLGSNQTIKTDVRVVSATNRNLELEVEEGRFRADLFYRLAVYQVHVPPLRERVGDIDVLTDHFVGIFSERERRKIDGVDSKARELLHSFDYPGNVRELENVLSYAVVSARASIITIADLPPSFLRAVSRRRGKADVHAPEPVASGAPILTTDTFPTLAMLEQKHIQKALELAGGNKTAASSMLGISRMTLYRKLAEMAAVS